MILRTERGVALPIALLTLVVVGALSTAVWIQAVRDRRLTRAAVRLEQAFAAAEAGLAAVVESGAAADTGLPAGSERTCAGRSVSGGGWYRCRIARLNSVLYLIRAEGFSPDSLARQHVGLLVKRDPRAPGGVRRLGSRAFANLY